MSKNSLVEMNNYMLTDITKNSITNNSYSVALSKLSNVSPVTISTFNNIKNICNKAPNTNDKLYRVTNLNKNDSLKKVRDGKTFWGSIKKSDGSSTMAKLSEVKGPVLDSSVIMMSAMLTGIDQELGEIKEITKKIFSFLKNEKESEIESDLELLNRSISDFRFNLEDEKYINNNYKQAMEIKRTANKNILFYKKEISEVLSKDKQEEERSRYRELEELTELNQKAIALYTDNNLEEALTCFLKIPEKMRTPEMWLLIGNILMDQGRKDDAVFMYGRAILTDSTYYKAYYNLGNIYLSDDKFNMAIEQFKMASKYNPNNAYVFYNLGCAYLKAGDLKKAKYAFIRAIELKNNIADFHYNLAFVYKKLGKEKQAKTYLENYNKLTGQI